MGLKVGIVGLPNVGKSTIFNALTKGQAESANYPFCTIDPNLGTVLVPDTRLDQITNYIQPQKTIPTTMDFVDIAGLVEGASKGEGLGNQFLSHIRETDAIAHVVRCFEDPNVVHVSGDVNPLRDVEVIETELILADMETAQKRYQKIEKASKVSKDKRSLFTLENLKKILDHLNEGHPIRSLGLDEEQLDSVYDLHFITQKPVLYVCNIAENEYADGNKWTQQVEDLAKKQNQKVIRICGSIEAELAQLEAEDVADFLNELGITESGLNPLIRESYSLLGLRTFFTAGEKEVRAWTFKEGFKAPQAAGVIHTDFEKGFIRAETYHCEALFEHHSEANVKSAGKYRSEGKEYLVQDGDVMLFRFNV